MRPEGRHPRRSARGRGHRPPRSAAARPDRQSLRRRRTIPACDFSGLLEAIHEVDGIERIRFASPHPRHFDDALPRRDGAAAEGLPAPAPAGAVGFDARARGDAAPLHAGELPRSGGAIRATLPDVALSTDMIVGFPGETDADFDDTLSLTAAVRYHSMFSFKYSPRPNTLADKRLADDVAGGGEDAADRGAAGAAARHSARAERGTGRARRRRAGRRGEPPRARRSSPAGRRHNVVVNLPGPRSGSAGRCRCASSAPDRTACRGRIDNGADAPRL